VRDENPYRIGLEFVGGHHQCHHSASSVRILQAVPLSLLAKHANEEYETHNRHRNENPNEFRVSPSS
jgi:hypothetical protein